MQDTADEVTLPDAWDSPGVLSIVLQGGLFRGNLIETANHCGHWRQLLPAAEIILSISSSDIVEGECSAGVFSSLRLVASFRHDSQLQAAVDMIVESCDGVGLGDPALPLPPIKSDSPKLNNMNLQIAAAQRGLKMASGRYVLRIRTDIVFLDRSFLQQYAETAGLPRGEASRLHGRVMISWLFTLNPFTVERLPLHFSDWFHFGLLDDVRTIWAVPPVSLGDSVHYKAASHAPGSNAAERLFNIRLAVEQHLIYNCFRPGFPDLKLDWHNDQRSIGLSLDILLDNFTLCDLKAARCVFDKYGHEFTDGPKQFHCLTREDWLAMMASRGSDHRQTLADKIEMFEAPKTSELNRPFPRRFASAELGHAEGSLVNGEIVARAQTGVLFWGPYTTLQDGKYLASLEVTTLSSFGLVTLRALMNSGQTLLAERLVRLQPGQAAALNIAFDVTVAKASEVEVVCLLDEVREMAVAGLTISRRAADAPDASRYQQDLPCHFEASRLETKHGRFVGGEIVAIGGDGELFFGPHTTMLPGRYLAAVAVSRVAGQGTLQLKATAAFGSKLLATLTFPIGPGEPTAFALPFDVAEPGETKVEIVGSISGLQGIAVSGVTFSARPPDPVAPPRKLGLRRARC